MGLYITLVIIFWVVLFFSLIEDLDIFIVASLVYVFFVFLIGGIIFDSNKTNPEMTTTETTTIEITK